MKRIAFLLSFMLILVLTACGSVPNANNPPASNGPSTGELPATTQLILGTLKLDTTDQVVTAEQATELLPLWQTLQVLSDSDTAAQQEKDALVAQIQETMTAEQMQAITDMNLSRTDMMTIMQEQGMAMGAGPSGSQSNTQTGNSSSTSGRNSGPGDGMPPPDERGFPGGPGFSGQGQNMSADQIATAQAARQAAGEDLVPAPLLKAVIEYLQKKAGS